MSGKLEGLSFCITGKLNTFKNRDEAQEFIRNHGGLAKSSVVKGLSYLVTNSNTPTAKMQKALELGTQVINEIDLRRLVEK